MTTNDSSGSQIHCKGPEEPRVKATAHISPLHLPGRVGGVHYRGNVATIASRPCNVVGFWIKHLNNFGLFCIADASISEDSILADLHDSNSGPPTLPILIHTPSHNYPRHCLSTAAVASLNNLVADVEDNELGLCASR